MYSGGRVNLSKDRQEFNFTPVTPTTKFAFNGVPQNDEETPHPDEPTPASFEVAQRNTNIHYQVRPGYAEGLETERNAAKQASREQRATENPYATTGDITVLNLKRDQQKSDPKEDGSSQPHKDMASLALQSKPNAATPGPSNVSAKSTASPANLTACHTCDFYKSNLLRQNNRVDVLEKERDKLSALLESLEAKGMDFKYAERIEELEGLVDELREDAEDAQEETRKLEGQLGKAQSVNHALRGRLFKAKEAKEQIALKASKDLAALQSKFGDEKKILEERAGNFDDVRDKFAVCVTKACKATWIEKHENSGIMYYIIDPEDMIRALEKELAELNQKAGAGAVGSQN